jgi:hypothetical protein
MTASPGGRDSRDDRARLACLHRRQALLEALARLYRRLLGDAAGASVSVLESADRSLGEIYAGLRSVQAQLCSTPPSSDRAVATAERLLEEEGERLSRELHSLHAALEEGVRRERERVGEALRYLRTARRVAEKYRGESGGGGDLLDASA